MINLDCKLCSLKSPAAEALTDEELDTLAHNCAHINFKKGENIFREGTLATNIVYLRYGLVKIHMKGPVSEKILRITKAPAYLGLPTTFGHKINHYSATAISDVQICFISLDSFQNFIYNNGDFAYEIILDLCRSELNDYARFTNMSQKQIPGRLAEILLCMSEKFYNSDEFELPLNNNEIADLISTSRESVSRQLSEFCKEGVILLNKKKVKILNFDLLKIINQKG